MMSKTKEFDCVQLQHGAQQARQEQLAHLSEEEMLAYFAQLHERLLLAKSGQRLSASAEMLETSAHPHRE
ncbi:MAG: hypothetical protein K6U75_07815 [Firmicutes bacterium]|nr:hypothetical protein [Bacillota bacterium]